MSITRITELPPFPARPRDGHKGTFGRALFAAGSAGMSGAAVLCGRAALRSGAGLVQVATPASVLPIVSAGEPCYMTLALPEDERGRLSPFALQPFLKAAENASAAGIGPGLGTDDAVRGFVTALYRTLPLPLVVDADALNVLAGPRKTPPTAAAPRILTPHPGEFARLLGVKTADVQAQREKLAIEFAASWNVILVLKGAATIVTDGKQLYENTTGNSGMATGGTGDVLTGLLTGLLAQKHDPFTAAMWAVWLHGHAGDLAAADLSDPGLIASDVVEYLPAAWKSLLKS